MILKIWVRNDGTGVLDGEYKDGDIHQVFPDSFESSIGTQEKKSWLVVKIPEPPDVGIDVPAAILASDYEVDPSEQSGYRIKRARIYTLDWRRKFNSSEQAIIVNANAVLPDGATSFSGGSVTSGVVSGVFTFLDLSRK